MASQDLAVVEESGRRAAQGDTEEVQIERLVALGRALSDPIRVRMLGMMAEAAASGRGCCGLPSLGPAEGGDGSICVCEFQDAFGMGQSKVSYHVKKLKDAGLVSEEKRGRWHYYSLSTVAVAELVSEAAGWLGAEGVRA